MKKLNVPAKSRGVVLFAFNTDNIKYVQIAEQAARLIHHILNLPVTLITDIEHNSSQFDQIIIIDNNLENSHPGTTRIWRNGDRYRAYELSPYDETILIDTDYLILDKNLLKLFEQDFDYRIMTHNQRPDIVWTDRMGIYGLEYQWATVILFRKTLPAKMLFDLAGRVQRNYRYYMNLYHISANNFRNDYAFTIANNILNGYDQGMKQGVPWTMLTFANLVKSMTLNKGLITIKEPTTAHMIPQQNIHIMDKEYLLSDDFNRFVETVCQN